MKATVKFPLYIVADTQSQLDKAISFARQMLNFPRSDLFVVWQLDKKDEVVFRQDYETSIILSQVHGTKRAIITIGEELTIDV